MLAFHMSACIKLSLRLWLCLLWFRYPDEGSESVMFGYSLAFLNGTLLVGAPKLNTSQIQDGILEAGGLFSCLTDGDMSCSAYTIDENGNNIGKY